MSAKKEWSDEDFESEEREPITASEVYEHIRMIRDPEHPLTLEALGVVRPNLVTVDDRKGVCDVVFVPTINHCSMATLIGLSLRVKLGRCLPGRFKIRVTLQSGSHETEDEVNRQLNDKERIAAAMENPNLLNVINGSLVGSD